MRLRLCVRIDTLILKKSTILLGLTDPGTELRSKGQDQS